MSVPESYAPVEAVTPRNGAAVAAMVLGIIALVLSVVVIGGVVGVVALILGIVGVTRPGKKGMAVTGIVTGACALPVAFIALFFWLAFGMAAMAAGPRVRMAHYNGTLATISNLKTAIDSFEVDNGRLPTEVEGLAVLLVNPGGDLQNSWAGPYMQGGKLPLDGWGHDFVYTNEDKFSYNVISAGPDGQLGTDCVWRANVRYKGWCAAQSVQTPNYFVDIAGCHASLTNGKLKDCRHDAGRFTIGRAVFPGGGMDTRR